MRLPNAENAVVDPRKLSEYALNPEHDDGKHKARLFRELLGVSMEDLDAIIDIIKSAARTHEAIPGKLDRYVQRYTVDFDFSGPLGGALTRSVWIIRATHDYPERVTFYIL